MKKLVLLLSLITLFCQSTLAQTGGLNFQGIARNATGAVLANQKINLKFSILKITETGAVEYTETKEATTNAQGIFAVVVGEVNATNFAAIDWKVAPKFLKVEMDPAGGTSFLAMGTTRLQNVPFAYYANGVNANNIDGTVPVSKGGTGAFDAATARTNLGLVIGTNVQAPLTAGSDYLTPSGNAATATKLTAAKKINGVDFDGSTDITVTADASTLSGTIAITKGGTGATTAAGTRTNLGLVIGTNVQAPLTAGTDYLTPSGSAASLTSFPTLNQNTTGNAATALLAGNITATSNSSLTTLSNLTSVGTLTTGTISLTTDIKTSGAITASGYKIPNGTAVQYLMADGTTSSGVASVTFTNKAIVGSATETATSAVLEANSTSRGFLPPRMTNSERNAISNPAEGLIIWNTTENEINVFNGSLWVNMSGFTNQTITVGMKYQGGIVFHVFTINQSEYLNEQHGFIISSTDLNTDLGIVWSPFNAVLGSNNADIKRGITNTDIIVSYFQNFQISTSMREYAAGLARAYRGGGYNDWQLPTKDELNLVFQNRNLIGVFNLDSWYWSSTKDVNYTAWAQNLFNGLQSTKSYDTRYKVRAYRWF